MFLDGSAFPVPHLNSRDCLLHSYAILYQPFVDSFSRMCHEDAAAEVCLCQNERQTHSMVEVETVIRRQLALMALVDKVCNRHIVEREGVGRNEARRYCVLRYGITMRRKIL